MSPGADGYVPTALTVDDQGLIIGETRRAPDGGVPARARIVRVAQGRPGAFELVWHGRGEPRRLVSAGDRLFVLSDDIEPATGEPVQTLTSIDVASGATKRVVSYDKHTRVVSLSLSQGYLYALYNWSTSTGGGGVGRTSLVDGTSQLLAQGIPVGPAAVLAADLVWVAPGNGVYEVSSSGGAVRSLAVPSGAAIAASPRSGLMFVATGDRIVAFRSHGAAVTEIASGQTDAAPIIADDRQVFWASGGPLHRAIQTAPVAGGQVATLVTGQSPTAFAQDAGHLYWIDGATQSVMAAAKSLPQMKPQVP
jgi:hypothetical protein